MVKMNNQVSKYVFVPLFFLSGFSGLVYQLLWMRTFTTVLGSSIFSITIIVSVFMLGLLAGSYVAGWAIDKHLIRNGLRWYGILEILIGCCAYFIAYGLTFLQPAFGLFYMPVSDSMMILNTVLNTLVAVTVLIIPTSAMGATLPLLVHSFTFANRMYRTNISTLYAVNALGGSLSALVTGFYLIKLFGVNTSMQIAGLLNLLIGMTAMVFARHTGKKSHQEESVLPVQSPGTEHPGARDMIYIAFLTGFAGLCYEMLWIRSMNYIVNNSTYTFSLILTVFLGGIGIGSVAARALLYTRITKEKILSATLFILGIYGTVTVYIFYRFAYSDVFAGFLISGNVCGGGWYDTIGLNLLITLIIFLIPTICMGITFPVIASVYFERSPAGAGKSTSIIYALNLMGSIAGAIVPAFFFIPLLGIKISIILVAAIYLSISIYLNMRLPWRVFLNVFQIIIFFAVLISGFGGKELYSLEGLNEEQPGTSSLYYKEGRLATVKVFSKHDSHLAMSIDGVTIASDLYNPKEKSLAHLPFFTGREISNCLAVGLASGTTVYSLSLHHDLDRIDVVELVPPVFEASKQFKNTAGIHQNSRIKMYCDDIISYLRYTHETYDLISSDGKFGPLNKANTVMLSEDYYDLCKNHLLPSGLFIQWISTEIPYFHFKTILSTVRNRFPFSELFLNRRNLFIISSQTPFNISGEKIRELLGNPVMEKELAACNIYSPEEFISTYCGPNTGGGTHNVSNTLDYPILEYDYMKYNNTDAALWDASMVRNLLFLIRNLRINREQAEEFISSSGLNRSVDMNIEFMRSAIYFAKAHFCLNDELYAKAFEYFKQVIAINHPDNINDIAVSHKQTGDILLRQKKYRESLVYFTSALSLIRQYPDAYVSRGLSYYMLRQDSEAREDFEKALQYDPHNSTAMKYMKMLRN